MPVWYSGGVRDHAIPPVTQGVVRKETPVPCFIAHRAVRWFVRGDASSIRNTSFMSRGAFVTIAG